MAKLFTWLRMGACRFTACKMPCRPKSSIACVIMPSICCISTASICGRGLSPSARRCFRTSWPARRDRLLYSEHFAAPGDEVLSRACALALEGIGAKAGECAISFWSNGFLAQIQMHQGAGAGDRWVYRASQACRCSRRVARRLLRG